MKWNTLMHQSNAKQMMLCVIFFPFQNLCINPEVVRLGNVQTMNDRCLEMQKNKHGQKGKHTVCQFRHSGVAV